MNRETLFILLRLADRRRLAIICGLAAVGAFTEGIGFVLLVPLMALLIGQSGGGEDSVLSPVTQAFDSWGWAPSVGGLLALFAGLVALRAAADYMRVVVSLRQSIAMVDALRSRAVTALLAANWRLLSRMRQSENRAMLLSEIDRTGMAIDQFAGLTRIAIGLLAIALAATVIAPVVAAAGAVVGLIVFFLYRGLRQRAHALGSAVGTRLRAVHSLLEENLNALRAIKSFGKEDYARDAILAGFRSLREVRVRFAADTARARALLQTGAAILVGVLVWLALEQWQIDAIAVLPLVALFARALPQLSALLDTWQHWAHSAPAVLAAEKLIRDAEAAAEPPLSDQSAEVTLTKALRFEEVCFAHREDLATLEDIDLEIAAGECLALVGPSGAGKSTLADIAGGLLAPDSGCVRLDGTVLDAGRRRAWRQKVAYVDQNPALFHGSIRDNLLWARPDADEASLHHALEQAAAQFVHALPGGLDCPIGDSGRQLSGGERQRIVLARALLRSPDLLILDEATSALDGESESAVAQAIEALKGQQTILIISHRGTLIDIASRRITIEKGRLVEDSLGGIARTA